MTPPSVTQCNPCQTLRSTVRNSPLNPAERVWHLAALKYGLTLEGYCASRLKRSRFHVHQVLSGKRLSPGLMEKIAEDLGLSVGDLLPDQNPTGSLWPA